MFKGWDVKYPEYEVITPQTGKSFSVRSLTVQEEERLKGSLVTPQKIHEHLNKCIYEAIVSKPEDIKDLDTFMKKVTLKDRDALLYGLYHITYEDIRNYDLTCTSCKKDYAVTLRASTAFNFTQYPGDDVLKKKIPVQLPTTKNVTAIIKQPTLFDESFAYKSTMYSSKPDIVTETLVIDRFQYVPEGASDAVVYVDRDDVVDAYLNLAAKDKREIYKQYKENFGKYGIDLKMISSCVHCGHEDEYDIDLVTNFFRMAYSV
jgi:hypothetical protein